ncbi:TIR domain-containing protein [Clostridium beijerinckii]|uniref:SEFIR domain-containing protein n=1 Tax=Clostridium beijerinckii TaxID=1520 RepID=UPI00222616AE|nr:TIR domain-containing protein [Clostridium beijerinckii]UYZ34151.1 TIR domain-containing protein [Clostridium beijerinckii]
MEQKEEKRKKVFISYCWTNYNHEQWVLDLAKRLVDDNVHVILDKWDLKPGQDKYKFMESMVLDPTIDKVLMICEKGYKREGGVGTETQIITPELYEQISQTKYIPIVAEEGENDFSKYIPQYIKGRIAIQMSTQESYIKGYEELLRVIFDKPQYERPQFGKTPSFITNESKMTSKLYFLNKTLDKYIEENRDGMIESTIQDFKDKLFNELDSFVILKREDLKEPYNIQLFNYIDDLKIIRDEYLTFLETLICNYKNFDSDIIIEMFEELYKYTEYQGSGNYGDFMMEHFQFFMTELFIWTNVLLFKYKKYQIIKEILYTRYYIKSRFGSDKCHFSKFRFWLNYLESNQNSPTKYHSIMAEKIIRRSNYKNKDYRDEIIETDIILSYISKISGYDVSWHWFPLTYAYKREYSKIKIIEKMERKKYFDEIKTLFNVTTKEEMKKLIEEKLSEVEQGYTGSFRSIPLITQSINVDDIGKY